MWHKQHTESISENKKGIDEIKEMLKNKDIE